MQYRLQSISRRITSLGNLTVSIVILFPKDNQLVYRKLSHRDDETVEFIDIKFPSFLRIEFPWELGGNISRRSINLTFLGKIQFLYMVEAFMKILKTEQVFIDDPELGLVVAQNVDQKGNNLWLKYEQIGKNVLMLYPKVIDDESTGHRYEGVAIAINTPAVSVTLTVSEFCILYKILSDVDIFVYGQLLLAMVKSDFIKRGEYEQEEFDLVTDKLSDLTELAMQKVEEGSQDGEGRLTIGRDQRILYRN